MCIRDSINAEYGGEPRAAMGGVLAIVYDEYPKMFATMAVGATALIYWMTVVDLGLSDGGPLSLKMALGLWATLASSTIFNIYNAGQTLPSRVRRASPGSVVEIKPGVYDLDEPLDLPNGVTLLGLDSGVVLRGRETPVIDTSALGSTLKNLTLQVLYNPKEPVDCVVIAEGSDLVMDECEIKCASGDCVRIFGMGTAPTLQGCLIHEGRQQGVMVSEEAKPMLRHCQIWGHQMSCVMIIHGGNPTFHECVIHSGEKEAITFHEAAEGHLIRCHIHSSALAGVLIGQCNPILDECKIEKCGMGGLSVELGGSGQISNCEFIENKLAAIVVGAMEEGGAPVVTDCVIRDSSQWGIIIHEGAGGAYSKCVVQNNGSGGDAGGIEIRVTSQAACTEYDTESWGRRV
eukprot:TRINITY_DN4213_c0_g3_i2.p1 TRINITY_DN4213_c0_g3~~TRINITY_DN4213_c0_g3_i2.p1  ORF type:complete len:403 (+),score=75.40 TRINITY_DN4213_c0_g3_i2:128-1336(+)